jgi:transcriptional regulator with PAS, ATPase and Fis domain
LRSPGVTTGLPAVVAGDCSLESMEKFAIRQALRMAGNNKSRAAELLGLSRTTLYRKLKDYDLDSAIDEVATIPPAA